MILKNDEFFSEAMANDEIEDPEKVDIVPDDQDDENMENIETKNLEQEFTHNKDKTKENKMTALDAMDIDIDEKQEIKENLTEKERPKDGKSIDMTELKDAITVDTLNVERNTDTIFGHVKDESVIVAGKFS